jgi:hypothetical protein
LLLIKPMKPRRVILERRKHLIPSAGHFQINRGGRHKVAENLVRSEGGHGLEKVLRMQLARVVLFSPPVEGGSCCQQFPCHLWVVSVDHIRLTSGRNREDPWRRGSSGWNTRDSYCGAHMMTASGP